MNSYPIHILDLDYYNKGRSTPSIGDYKTGPKKSASIYRAGTFQAHTRFNS